MFTALVFTENVHSTRGLLVRRSTAAVPVGSPSVRVPKRLRRKLRDRRPRTSASGTAFAHAANPFDPGYRGQCTWYAWGRRPDLGNATLSHGYTWANSARRAGFPVSSTPAAGTIAVWPRYFAGAGWAGHVAYVERVLPGNRIHISEYNWVRPLTYGERTISAAGLQFIYRRGQNPGSSPPPPPFTARLDAQFPADGQNKVHVTAGAPGVAVGWNIRFNQPFSVPHFVMRPDTPSTINRFSSVRGDFPGAVAPNDDHVGYYRAAVQAPAGTPSGTYFMRWNVTHSRTGQFGGLQPSFELVVLPPGATPPGGGVPPSPGPGPCPPPAPGGPFQLSPDPSFKATIDSNGQFPMDANGVMHVSRGDTVPFGYNIRFNQPANAQNFALRTDTPGTINYFSSVKGDWRGTVPPNDDHVLYYRAAISVAPCVPPGDYFLRWNVINMATGKWGSLQPSFVLRVG